MRIFWMGSKFDKVFYFWGDSNARVEIKRNLCYWNKTLYGVRIEKGFSINDLDLSTVRYIELGRELTEDESKIIQTNCKNLELINIEVKSNASLIAELCNKLPAKYVHWGFLDGKDPFSELGHYLSYAYGPEKVEELRRKFASNWQHEIWFHEYFEQLSVKNSLKYLELKCVSDWAVGLISPFAKQLKGIIISAPLSQNALDLLDENFCDDNLVGFICNLKHAINPPLNVYGNNIRYFCGIINLEGIVLRPIWKQIVACSTNLKLFGLMAKHSGKTLRDANIIYSNFPIPQSYIDYFDGELQSFQSLRRLRCYRVYQKIFNGKWPKSLSIIEAGTLTVTKSDIPWLTTSVRSVYADTIFLLFEMKEQDFKSSQIRDMIFGSFGSRSPVNLDAFLKRMQPTEGYDRLYVYNAFVLLNYFKMSNILAKRKIYYSTDNGTLPPDFDAKVLSKTDLRPFCMPGRQAVVTDDFVEGVEAITSVSEIEEIQK